MIRPKLILYHANWSLCSQMVRVALYEKGLEFEDVPIKLCDHYEEAENISKDFLKNINSTGVVPVLKIDNEIVRDSAFIIERLDDLQGTNNINLWPREETKRKQLRDWVNDTTISEGVPMGKTLGTTIPLFSMSLIEVLIKKLSYRAIWNIILKHPRRERKIAFVTMYFSSLKDRVGPIAYKGFVKGILELESNLPEDGFLFGDFSHADINLMCCFYRLQDLRLDSVLEMSELPKINAYWKNLKSRDSFKKGILDFKDHEEKLNQIFLNKDNPHLEKLKDKIKESIKI